MQRFSFILLMVSEKKTFEYFSKIYPVSRTSNQSNSDKTLMKCGELFNKKFCKNRIQLSPMRQQKLPISIFPIISLWKF